MQQHKQFRLTNDQLERLSAVRIISSIDKSSLTPQVEAFIQTTVPRLIAAIEAEEPYEFFDTLEVALRTSDDLLCWSVEAWTRDAVGVLEDLNMSDLNPDEPEARGGTRWLMMLSAAEVINKRAGSLWHALIDAKALREKLRRHRPAKPPQEHRRTPRRPIDNKMIDRVSRKDRLGLGGSDTPQNTGSGTRETQ